MPALRTGMRINSILSFLESFTSRPLLYFADDTLPHLVYAVIKGDTVFLTCLQIIGCFHHGATSALHSNIHSIFELWMVNHYCFLERMVSAWNIYDRRATHTLPFLIELREKWQACSVSLKWTMTFSWMFVLFCHPYV